MNGYSKFMQKENSDLSELEEIREGYYDITRFLQIFDNGG